MSHLSTSRPLAPDQGPRPILHNRTILSESKTARKRGIQPCGTADVERRRSIKSGVEWKKKQGRSNVGIPLGAKDARPGGPLVGRSVARLPWNGEPHRLDATCVSVCMNGWGGSW